MKELREMLDLAHGYQLFDALKSPNFPIAKHSLLIIFIISFQPGEEKMAEPKRFEVAKVARLIHAVLAERKARLEVEAVFLANWGYAERNDTSEYEATLVDNVEREVRYQLLNLSTKEEIEEVLDRFADLCEKMQ